MHLPITHDGTQWSNASEDFVEIVASEPIMDIMLIHPSRAWLSGFLQIVKPIQTAKPDLLPRPSG